jgi:nucleotide-binding universal stress UspA family protein
VSDNAAFRSILVPVDGSPLAEAAIPTALAIAERARSKLQLVMVYADSFPPQPIAPAKQYLEDLARCVRQQLGDSVSAVLLEGPVGSSLVKHACKTGPDLVVMTTHGRGGLERAWLGSVADQLIRTAGIPMLIVRPRDDGTVPVFEPSEILVPLDGSPLAERALRPAVALARLWDAEVSLLQIIQPLPPDGEPAWPLPAGYDTELTRISCESASEYLSVQAEHLRRTGIRASGVAMTGTAGVAQTLVEVATPTRVGLLAMATHGRGGLRRIVLGSVTDKVVRGAQVPVLVIPAVRAPRHKQERRAANGEELAQAAGRSSALSSSSLTSGRAQSSEPHVPSTASKSPVSPAE